MSEVRGRSGEDPMLEGRWPRGATLHLRTEVVAESARLRQRRSSQEELPYVRGQGRRPGGANPRLSSGGCAGAGGPRGDIPRQGQEGRQ